LDGGYVARHGKIPKAPVKVFLRLRHALGIEQRLRAQSGRQQQQRDPRAPHLVHIIALPIGPRQSATMASENMKHLRLFLAGTALAGTVLATMAVAQPVPKFGKNNLKVGDPLTGRWDFTLSANGTTYPDWLLVYVTDTGLAGTLQPRSGGTVAAEVTHKGS